MGRKHQKDIMIEGEPGKPIIYILHGYGSNPKEAKLWANYFIRRDFTVIIKRARGHERSGKKWRWIETIKEYMKELERNKKRVYVIGHSMGGTMAIYLAKSRYTIKIFAISALHDTTIFEEDGLRQKLFKLKYDGEIERAKRSIYPALPVNYSLTQNQAKKLYLIHDRFDHYVRFDQFEKNKKKFKVPASRTLVVKKFRHGLTPNDLRVLQFVGNRIRENPK